MIVITVARKPLSEGSVAANILKHGTGGLNIDGCRLATGESLDGGAYAKNPTPRAGKDLWTQDRKGDTNCMRRGGAGDYQQPTGRWPANLILGHLPECRCVGVKKVKGVTGGATSGDNAFGQDTGWNPHENRPTGITRTLDAEGQETVAAWECLPGCPVAGLDQASGSCSTGLGGVTKKNDARITMSGPASYQDRETIGYGDTGGASRFFKQVGEQRQAAPTTLDTITFHEEEAEDARKSLEGSGVVCTARWGTELDKYGQGEALLTPWGHEVCLFALECRQGWESHPHKELLTPRLKQGIGDGPFDLLYLHVPVVQSPRRGGK